MTKTPNQTLQVTGGLSHHNLVSAASAPAPELWRSAAEGLLVDKNALLIGLSESYSVALGGVAFSEQPEPHKVFSAIWELESQVNNGGFDQYFRNSDSDVIGYAPTALSTIGALSCAGIVERAIQVIAPLPPTQEGRYRVLDAQGESAQEWLAGLDAEFFVYPNNLTELLFEYVRQHPAAFGPLPRG